MGTDDLFHKRKRDLARRQACRSARPRILIVCEGKKTEPDYFRSFPVTSADIRIVGEGFNTKSLVAYARRKEQEALEDKDPYDRVWCVFDADSFSKEQFNAAVQMAESSGFRAAYSNEAFELWYVLHFEYLTAALKRGRYNTKLTGHLGVKYKKNRSDMYERLKSRQAQAVKRAEQLCALHKGLPPADRKPCTTVHLLVKELNGLM